MQPPPPPVHDHVQQPPLFAPHFTQSQQFADAADIYGDVPRDHVDQRTHLAPAGRGKLFHQYYHSSLRLYYVLWFIVVVVVVVDTMTLGPS